MEDLTKKIAELQTVDWRAIKPDLTDDEKTEIAIAYYAKGLTYRQLAAVLMNNGKIPGPQSVKHLIDEHLKKLGIKYILGQLK